MRTPHLVPAVLAAALLLTATACSTDGDKPKTKPATATSATAEAPASAPRKYDRHDCRAILERNFEAEANRDASTDAECAGLTRDEYEDLVAEVLTGRKDEILKDSAKRVTWDLAWEETPVAQREIVCDRLAADGAVVVGQEMMERSGGANDQIEMSQYFLDTKCAK